jgi:hypothetical protein
MTETATQNVATDVPVYEPNFKRWRDPATGLVCMAIRNLYSGSLCGYVRVPHSNLRTRLAKSERTIQSRWRGRVVRACAYNHSAVRGIRVHGGLTFSGRFHRQGHSQGYWLGFDCAHYGDMSPGLITRMAAAGVSSAFMNEGVYRTLAFVENECAGMARQLADILKKEQK